MAPTLPRRIALHRRISSATLVSTNTTLHHRPDDRLKLADRGSEVHTHKTVGNDRHRRKSHRMSMPRRSVVPQFGNEYADDPRPT